MTDYTPDTEEVRASADWGAFTNRDEFDRWLATHDETVRLETARQAVMVARSVKVPFQTFEGTTWIEGSAGAVADALEMQFRTGHVTA